MRLSFLSPLLTAPGNFPREQQRCIVLVSVTGMVTALYHGVLVGLFHLMGLSTLALYNVVSVAAWIGVVLLARRGGLYAPALIVVGEISVYVALCVRYLGWESGAPFLLLNLVWTFFALPFNLCFKLFFAAAFLAEFVLLYLGAGTGVWLGEPMILELFWFQNVVMVFCFAALSAAYLFNLVNKAELALEEALQRSEDLLNNVLPPPIAHRLKNSEGVIADSFSGASVLFADIADFTPLSQGMAPSDVVSLLDDLFSRMDLLVHQHGLEKIKTIGDAYMVAAGIPLRRDDHAAAIVAFALDLKGAVTRFNTETGQNLRLRIGINSGPVTAGVIGRMRFLYDLWGDSVNTASRMESHGVADEIHLTEETRTLLGDSYLFEERGEIDVKGKGKMRTYFLRAPRE
jgi:class 3 adenylate cyclase